MHQSEVAWFKKAQEIAKLGNWDQDPVTGELWWSDQSYRLFHLDPQQEKMYFDRFLSMVHPDDRKLIVDSTAKLLAFDDFRYQVEYRIICRDDERVLYEEAFVERNEKGEPVKIIGFMQDITERKQVEEALSRSEQQLKSYIECAGDAIYIVEVDTGRIRNCNPRACLDLGYNRDELLDLAVTEIEVALTAEEVFGIRRTLARGEVATVEGSHKRKNGSIFPVEVRSNLLSPAQHGLMISIVRDISDRKKVEVALREGEKELLAAQRLGKTGSWTYDPESQQTLWSEGMFHIWGLNPKHGPPHYSEHRKYIHPDDFAKFDAAVKQAVEFGKPYEMELRILRPDDAERTIITVCEPQCDDTGKVVKLRGLNQDITEKKELENQLRQSQKMQAIGTLAGGVAHDFNNILQAIIGFGTYAKKHIRDYERATEYIDEMLAGANRAAELTKGLLAFSRKQVICPKPHDLNSIVTNMAKLLGRVLSEEIEFRTLLSDREILVKVDATHIDQVLLNLVTNARDAMPDGGQLTIETGVVDIDRKSSERHNHELLGKYGVMTISDTGTGMDLETKQNIFEPFFTTKEVGKGTGLGLAMAYGIVKQHEGSINVDSEPGIGTTFRIYLPLIQASKEIKPDTAKDIPLGKGQTILIAEDDASVRKVTRIILQEYGYKTIEAENGEEAVRKYIENADKVSMLLLDVIMPVKNGRDAYVEIMKIKPDIKAIFMSGYADDILANKGKSEEGYMFISKPINPDAMIRIIGDVLDT